MNESSYVDGIEFNWTLIGLANVSINCSDLSQNTFLSSYWIQIVLYILYGTVFLLALLGNSLICYIVYRNPRMRSVTNCFIVNLAVGDILMDIFCVPTTFFSTLVLQYWPFGPTLCPFVNFCQALTVLVSTYTLVAISIDRYIAIMWPFKPKLGKTHAACFIFGVWFIATFFSSPIVFVSELVQPSLTHKYCGLYICQESWPSSSMKTIYTGVLVFVQYLIPMIALIFTYTRISCKVWQNKPPGEIENNRDERMQRSKRKMVKMMIIVVAVFTLCWAPFNALNLAMDSSSGLVDWVGLAYVWTGLHWLAMSHTCYNPVIYCWMNARFRSGFFSVLAKLPGVSRLLQNRGLVCNTSVAGFANTGTTVTEHYLL